MRATLEVLRQAAAKATAAPVLLACLFLSECERVYSAWIDVDLQGGRSPVCENEEFAPVRGPGNWVVTGHATTCDGTVTYIYLHRADAPERSINQIFRYVGVDPKIAWVAPDQIRVTVDGAQDVSKQVTDLNGMTITYEIVWYQRWPPPLQN